MRTGFLARGLGTAAIAVMALLTATTMGCGGGAGGAGGAGDVIENEGLPPVADFQARLLAGGFFRGLWGTGPDDVFGVGGDGLLARFDGTQWRPIDPPGGFDRDFADVFGFSSSDVYAVGDTGMILHYDGTAWTRQAVEGGLSSALRAVWGSGPNDVYASGEGTIVHFDGAAWRRVTAPGVGAADWRGISGSGPNEVLFAGEGGNFQTAHFLHFDGASWNTVAVPTIPGNTYLNDVWSTGPDRAIAVGVGGRALTWNGTTLTDLPRGTNESLTSVWAASPTQVFAVGVRNTFLRFDGATWGDLGFSVGSDSVTTIFGFAGNELVAGGRGVFRFEGAAFETLLPAGRPTGLWVGAPDDVLILGEQTLRYDGQRVVPEDFGGLAVPRLQAAWGPPDHVVAVGDGGSAFLYDGASWGAMTTNVTEQLTSVWGASRDDVFAVGQGGTILHFNGVAWGAMASNTAAWLSGVWGTSGDDVYAVGDAGTILHYDGTSWSPMATGVTAFLRDIHGFDASSIRVAYAGGLLVGDGVTWSPRAVEAGGIPLPVYALDGTGPNDMVLSLAGVPVRYDGTTATPFSSSAFAAFVAVAGPRTVLAGGVTGAFDERVVLYSAR